jgi:hypothetical protein
MLMYSLRVNDQPGLPLKAGPIVAKNCCERSQSLFQAVNRQCGISMLSDFASFVRACRTRTSNVLRTEAASHDRFRVALLHLKLCLIAIAPEADIKSVATEMKIEQR